MSDWDCTLESGPGGEPALRLGLRMIKGVSRQGVGRLVRARLDGAWRSVEDLARRAALDRRDLQALASADALSGLAGNRHQAGWQVAGIPEPLPLLPPSPAGRAMPLLPVPGEGEAIVADYASLGLTLRRHPLALLRECLERQHPGFSPRDAKKAPQIASSAGQTACSPSAQDFGRLLPPSTTSSCCRAFCCPRTRPTCRVWICSGL